MKLIKRNTLRDATADAGDLLLQAAAICGILKQIPQKGELFHDAV